jgi:hypothetical protein
VTRERGDRERGCLGIAGGARGVDDDGDIVFVWDDGGRDGAGGHLTSPSEERGEKS